MDVTGLPVIVTPGWSSPPAGMMLELEGPNTPIPALLLPAMTVIGEPVMSTEDCFWTPTPVAASRAERLSRIQTLRTPHDTALKVRLPTDTTRSRTTRRLARIHSVGFSVYDPYVAKDGVDFRVEGTASLDEFGRLVDEAFSKTHCAAHPR